ncbi:MAG: hypothetical protein EBT12_16625 [Marivivens sp.]|nr:hypothetical protein [Marivivens sp.]
MCKFFELSVKNRLRVLGDNLRTPFTGGAEARLGRTERLDGWEVWKKLEVFRARRAVQVRAHLVRFVSALFDIDITEEIEDVQRFNVKDRHSCLST